MRAMAIPPVASAVELYSRAFPCVRSGALTGTTWLSPEVADPGRPRQFARSIYGSHRRTRGDPRSLDGGSGGGGCFLGCRRGEERGSVPVCPVSGQWCRLCHLYWNGMMAVEAVAVSVAESVAESVVESVVERQFHQQFFVHFEGGLHERTGRRREIPASAKAFYANHLQNGRTFVGGSNASGKRQQLPQSKGGPVPNRFTVQDGMPAQLLRAVAEPRAAICQWHRAIRVQL